MTRGTGDPAAVIRYVEGRLKREVELADALVEAKAVIVLLFGTIGLPGRAIDAPWYERTVAALGKIDEVLSKVEVTE